jgi:hypothetical protein
MNEKYIICTMGEQELSTTRKADFDTKTETQNCQKKK